LSLSELARYYCLFLPETFTLNRQLEKSHYYLAHFY
jgi:hypothetical protein